MYHSRDWEFKKEVLKKQYTVIYLRSLCIRAECEYSFKCKVRNISH